MNWTPAWQAAAAFILGLCIGSFLNVLIYRLPRRESIAFPGSRCPSCGTSIAWYDNIPLAGYLLLRGTCRSCGAGISLRYPVIEFLTGTVIAALYLLHGGMNAGFVADAVFACILLVAAVIDIGHMIIPNRLTFPSFVIAVLLSFRFGWYGLVRGALGIAVGIGFLVLMYLLGRLLFRRESVGFGDFKFVLVIGFFAGPLWTFVIFLIGILVGGTWGAVRIATGATGFGQEVPFGPFLSLGGFAVLFFREPLLFLIDRYLMML